MRMLGLVLTAVVSYLLGSINFGVLLSQKKEKGDVRKHGSGNAGMTNVLRVYGKELAVLTAVGDFLKAVVAICVARQWIAPFFNTSTMMDIGYIAGLFVLLGHIYPLFFGFRGGKGVMTSLGIIFILEPIVFVILVIVGLLVVYVTRIVSLASIGGAILFPILTFLARWIQGKPWIAEVLFSLLFSLIVIYMHRDNIARLRAGTENRFEKKPKNE